MHHAGPGYRFRYKMSTLNFQTTIQKLPLFLGGILLIYLAVADESLFNIILGYMSISQFSVALATTIAAAIPMFFAVGLLRRSILIKLDTIYYYEKFIDSKIYWFSTVTLVATFAYLNIKLGGSTRELLVAAACVALAIYLMIYTLKNNRP